MKYTNMALDFNGLQWWPELGIGHHPAEPMAYDSDYWDRYRELDNTKLGDELTAARIKFVRQRYNGALIDVGIGGGRFVEVIEEGGFDVNPEAVTWLHERGIYADPYEGETTAVTCWDSLEHMEEPERLIECVTGWVFVSMPIYRDAYDCLESKHYKPGEHLWYWTNAGLINWFEELGFVLVERSNFETRLGREGIESYAFKRII